MKIQELLAKYSKHQNDDDYFHALTAIENALSDAAVEAWHGGEGHPDLDEVIEETRGWIFNVWGTRKGYPDDPLSVTDLKRIVPADR